MKGGHGVSIPNFIVLYVLLYFNGFVIFEQVFYEMA